MKHLDLFSGVGGFPLAASWVWGKGHEIVSFCEIDPFCQKVLKKHWPDVPCHDDIKTLKGDSFGAIDLISGGVPCQPASCAGKRKGREHDRNLWIFRVMPCKKCWYSLIHQTEHAKEISDAVGDVCTGVDLTTIKGLREK